ncbi:hypothetical protein C9374_011908 [Naegleria lovaniensis]|uniref:Uncharacterized protein n=1 Tax=Naegleria lovaniensis TaxID=51637 RepID=A0AA88GFG0_NAELO|nr:uncharacterized protein C9374_011908 [Naegleria lovaniensis]KAG2373619.1 hypothetical protein C9374_011908 [Naegleria lovaniensis]
MSLTNHDDDPNNNESTPFLSRNHHPSAATHPPTNRSDLNGSTSPSETHDIFVNALYSRLGPCLENNYNATPFNSHIVSHGWVNKTMTSSSSQHIGISMETIKKTCLQVIEQQRTNLNQFNSTNGLMTIKATYQLQNVHIHVLEHHYNNRFFFYLCIAHSNVPVRVCFGLLERCKNEMSPSS